MQLLIVVINNLAVPLGYMFDVLEESVIMAAGMGSKTIFSFPYAEQLRAYQMKMNWAEGSFSDPITILNAYQVWKEHCHSDYFRRSGQTEHEREAQWARKSFVQLRALKVSWCKFRIPHSMSSVACVYFFIGNGLPGR